MLVCVLVACGKSSKTPPVRDANASVSVDAAAPVAVVDAAAVPARREPLVAIAGYPEPVATPPVEACRVAGIWEPEQPRGLALTPGGKPYVRFNNPDRAAEVAIGDASRAAFVDLSSQHVRLTGFVSDDELRLHAAAPFVVAGYAIPSASLVIRWRGAATDAGVPIELQLPPIARPFVPPRDRRPCGDLALDDKASFDPIDALDVDAGDEMEIEGKRHVLFAEPGKNKVVELRFEKHEYQAVDVIERRDGHARVVVRNNSLDPDRGVYFVGWIPEQSLRARTGGFGGSWARGGPRGTVRQRKGTITRSVTCPQDTPLVAELGAERRLVGALAANVAFDVTIDDGTNPDDLVAVDPTKAAVEIVEGARLLAKRAALASCK